MKVCILLFSLIVFSQGSAEGLKAMNHFPSPVFPEEIVVKDPVETEDILYFEILDFNNFSGVTVEVGAFDRPLCLSCIHLDVSPSGLEETKYFFKSRNVVKVNTEVICPSKSIEIDSIFDKITTIFRNPIRRTNWGDPIEKLNFTGILGDIRNPPFLDESIDQFILANFPWFEATKASNNIIRKVLESLYQKLSYGGKSYLLGTISDVSLNPNRGKGVREAPYFKVNTMTEVILVFDPHRVIAKDIGFKVISFIMPGFVGLLLEK